MKNVTVKTVKGFPKEAMDIRCEVFVDEQGFRDEFDDIDGIATHFLLWQDGESKAVATCRIFPTCEANSYVLGRLAVRKAYRKSGLGRLIVRHAEDEAKRLGARKMKVHSQAQAEGFYLSCGYVSTGVLDEEEGCPHVWLEKDLQG